MGVGSAWGRVGSPAEAFAALPRARAEAAAPPGRRGGWSVARNGTIIEQAQVLTTHNLAALVATTGLAMPWADLARRCLARVVELVDSLDRTPRPLATVKDAAYAWRQMLFFLALAPELDRTLVVGEAAQAVHEAPPGLGDRLSPLVAGLSAARAGASLDNPASLPPGTRRFLGWTVGPHWIVAAGRAAGAPR